MKKIYTFIFVTFLFASGLAQSPEAFNYQAVARDAAGSEIVSTTVGLQISILQGNDAGTPVYVETFTPATNAFGLFTVEIGKGTIVSGDFSTIDWGDGPYFVKSELDPAGGRSYTDLGASPLMSVPYALQARHAETAISVENALYADTAMFADSAHYADMAGNVFDGDYNSLSNTPDWNDTIAMRLDSAIFLTDTAAAGNLITYDGMNWIAKDLLLSTNNTGSGLAFDNMQPSLVLNYCIALQGLYPSRNIMEPFIGTIAIFGFNFAPRSWAKCDGQLLPIASYQALFSLLGTIYGGDGRTTFGLPDLRGRVPVHMGRGPGLLDRRQGQKFGNETTVIGVQNLPPHNHVVNISYE